MILLKLFCFVLVLAKIKANDFENSENGLSDKCPNIALNSLFETLTPDDYEEVNATDIYEGVRNFRQTLYKFERLRTFSQNISKKFDNLVNKLSARMSEVLMEIELPSECMTALAKIATGVQNKKSWAMKFTDTIPFPSGMNMPSNSYDECLEFQIPDYELTAGQKIGGHYCWAGFAELPEEYDENLFNETVMERLNEFSKNSTMYKAVHTGSRLEKNDFQRDAFFQAIVVNNWRKTVLNKLPFGLCLPNTCKAQDIENALNKVLYPIIRFPLTINPDCDYVDKPIKLNNLQWMSIKTFSVLILLVIISTFYDLFMKFRGKQHKIPKKSLVSQLSQSFSAINNFRAIFSLDRPKKNFRFLDGLRAILTLVIVMFHEHESSLLVYHARGMAFIERFFFSRNYMHIKNFNIVDTFFFIGAFLCSYILLSKLEKSKGRFNYLHFALYRYSRVIPSVVGPILLIYLFPLLGNGPFWEFTSNIMYIPCRDNWLPSILMTSNFEISLPDKYICNTSAWFIATDYQLFLLAPIIILVLYHRPKAGVIWNLILMLVGILVCLAPRVIWNIPHFLEYPASQSFWTYVNLVIPYYWRADPHFISYVMGIFCGYLVRQKPNLYFGGRIGELFLWITTFLLMFWSIWWTNKLFDPYIPLSKAEMLLFLAFSKPLYLTFWFWLIYACATGRAGFTSFVSRFFSWQGFKPFSFLAFEISVLHTMVIFYRVGTDRDPVVYSAYYVWTLTCVDYFTSFLFSILFYIVVSGPFGNLVQKFV